MPTFCSKYETLAGKKFGHLTVRGVADGVAGKTRLLCKCDCGAFKIVQAYHLVSGNTKSCGHLSGAPRLGAGRPVGNRTLSKEAREQIRELKKVMTGKQIAALYGISRKTVHRYASKH